MTSQRERWLLLAILLLMLVLQVAVARRQSLWADEIFSLAIATGHSLEQPAAASHPELGDFVEPAHAVTADLFQRYLRHDQPAANPARIVRAVYLSDTSPPLYYLLLYGWTLLCGTSDLALRLFSITCSLASLPLMAALARRMGGPGAVLPACLFFAFSPLALYYSTEGRMYSLLLFVLLATVSLALRLRDRGGNPGSYLLWSAASAAGLLTHYFFLFPWLALIAFLLVSPGRFKVPWLLLCLALACLAIVPWYWNLPASLNQWRVTHDWLNWRPPGFHRSRAVASQLLQFFTGAGFGLWPGSRWSSRASLLLVAAIFVLMGWRLRSRMFQRERLLLWLWMIAACLAPTIIDYLRHTYVANVPRYALAGLPAAFLLLASAVALFNQPVRALLVALLLLTWARPVWSIYRQTARDAEPFRAAARAANTGSPDLILVHSIPSGVLGIARYSDKAAPMASWVGQLGTRQVPASLSDLLVGKAKVALIKLHAVGEPAPEEDWLRSNGQITQEKRIGAATFMEVNLKGAKSY